MMNTYPQVIVMAGWLCFPLALLANEADKETVLAARFLIDENRGPEAASMLLPLAGKGDAEAAYWLGRIYFYGKTGVPRSDGESLRWFSHSAVVGHAGAQYKLGGIYFAGRGVEKDASRAAAWWIAASQQGHAESLNNLGAMLTTGQGTQRDEDLGMALQILAAEKGSEAAEENLRRKGIRATARSIALELTFDPDKFADKLAELLARRP